MKMIDICEELERTGRALIAEQVGATADTWAVTVLPSILSPSRLIT